MTIPVIGFIAAQLLSLSIGGLIVFLITEYRRRHRKRTALGQADVVLSMFDKANAETAARNAGV